MRRALLSAVLCLAAVVAFPAVASAATTVRANADSVSNTWVVALPVISRCARVTSTAVIRYDAELYRSPSGELRTLKNIRLDDPTVTASIGTWSPSAGCGSFGSFSLSKLSITQKWTGYSCSFNPQISVTAGAGWGAGVGFWPSCGNKNMAKYSTTYSRTDSFYTQGNSGVKANFGWEYAPGSCYGVSVNVVGFRGSASDNADTARGSACLTPVY